MDACPLPLVAGNFFPTYTILLNFYIFFQSNIQHVSPASGDPPHRGSAPGPRWGTSVPRALLLPPPLANSWLRP